MAKLPTTEMTGECGRIVVNTSDIERYKKMGYKLLEDKSMPAKVEAVKDDEPPAAPEEESVEKDD